MNITKRKISLISIIVIVIVFSSYLIYDELYSRNEFKVVVKNLYNDHSLVRVLIGEKDWDSGDIKNIYDIKYAQLDYNEACVFHVRFQDCHNINDVCITAEKSEIYNTSLPDNITKFVAFAYVFPDNEYYDLMAIIIPRLENDTLISKENTPYEIHDIGPQDYADIIFTDIQDTSQMNHIYMDVND